MHSNTEFRFLTNQHGWAVHHRRPNFEFEIRIYTLLPRGKLSKLACMVLHSVCQLLTANTRALYLLHHAADLQDGCSLAANI